MSVGVGQDVESICNKCGDVWHVVVAKVGDKIAKVQCKECNGYHRYRPSGTKDGKQPRAAVASRSRRESSATKSAARAVARIDEPAVAANLARPVRPYQFTEQDYQPGDRIEHPKFGTGVIELTNEPGKMQVFFPDGRRILARAKPSSNLSRPRPFQHQDPE